MNRLPYKQIPKLFFVKSVHGIARDFKRFKKSGKEKSGDEGIAKQIPKLFFIKSVHGIARDFE